MRIAIYARKSSESEDRQIQSLEDQIKALQTLAQREGIEVHEVFQESRSAKAPGTRPEFQRLVKEIGRGRIDGVLTWSISRLGRNPVDGGQMAYLLQTGRLQLIRTIDRSYRPEDNALLMSIESGMATAYIQDLRRNVIRGMQGRVERGWAPCKAPLGYKNDPESREVTPDPDRFDLLRHGWDLLLSGKYTVKAIHAELAGRGLSARSRRGSSGAISCSRLRYIFRDRFYTGEIRFQGKSFPGRHQPMVSRAEFDEAQSYLRSAITTRPARHSFPFSGAIRCSKCGCAVVAEQKEKQNLESGRIKTYIYYHCSGNRGCAKQSVSERYVQELFRETIDRIALSSATQEWLSSALRDALERESTETGRTIDELQQEIRRGEARVNRLIEMRIDGELDSLEYQQLKGDAEKEIDQVKDRLQDMQEIDVRLLRMVYGKLDLAVQAHHLTGHDHDAHALGKLIPLVGTCTLETGRISIKLHPVIQKIASFEPLRSCSERPKQGDVLPQDSVWWALQDSNL